LFRVDSAATLPGGSGAFGDWQPDRTQAAKNVAASRKADAVRRSFDIVRKLRPILAPNRHVLRLGIKALASTGTRKTIMQQFRECLVELNHGDPVFFPDDVNEQEFS
jgi:hypothetical protein